MLFNLYRKHPFLAGVVFLFSLNLLALIAIPPLSWAMRHYLKPLLEPLAMWFRYWRA